VRVLVRELGAQLAQVGHRVGGRTGLRDVDLACLDLLARQGRLSPSALAKLLQVHPATMTGMLDRLETDGWIVRERDGDDRRAVLIGLVPARMRDLMGQYAGMNGAIDRIAASYAPEQLAVITDFLTRLSAASREASDDLAGERK
jgi:DNA-binding Lrp family transcriptional regulator